MPGLRNRRNEPEGPVLDEMYGMSWFEKLQLLAEVGPVLSALQVAFGQNDPHRQALAIVDAGRWAAGKTETTVDDELVKHVESVLMTAEGKALVLWAAKKLGVTSE